MRESAHRIRALLGRLRAAWAHPLSGYPAAIVGEVGAVALTELLRSAWPVFFPWRIPLVMLVVLAVGLQWGFGPSVVASVWGAVLSNAYLIPPYGDWFSIDRWTTAWATLSLLAVGLTTGLLARRTARARRQAEEAVRLRDQVLTLATHDLRTPLTVAIGYAEVLRDEARTERAARGAAALDEALWRINELAEELSDVAQLQVGRPLELHPEDLDLCGVVATMAAEYSLAEPGAVRVSLLSEELRVRADRGRLLRALDNVVANAVKYSPPGAPVQVTTERHGGEALVVVRDQGVGIPKRELRRVFQTFYRASTAGATAGTGLGLAEVRAITKQHGGRVELQSAPGQGTTVTLRLPLGERGARPPR